MANRFRGEVAVDVDGRKLVLVMNFNVMAEYEEATGEAAVAFLTRADEGKTTLPELRRFLHYCLLPRQPEATLEDAGDVLSEDSEALLKLLSACAPPPEDDAGKPKATRKKPPARR